MVRLLPLVFLFGCATSTTDKASDGDADTDADSDTDTDTDTDADLGPCPAYSGLAAGRTWSWAYTEEQAAQVGAGTWTSTVVSLGADGTWTMEGSGEYDIEGFDSYTFTSTSSGWCDADGAWMGESTSESTFVLGGREQTTAATVTYDGGYLSMPAGVTEGGSWTFQASGTTSSSSAPDNSFDYEVTLEAVGKGSKTVPAGTFTAMEFETTTQYGASSFWADANVGSIATDTTELVSVE